MGLVLTLPRQTDFSAFCVEWEGNHWQVHGILEFGSAQSTSSESVPDREMAASTKREIGACDLSRYGQPGMPSAGEYGWDGFCFW